MRKAWLLLKASRTMIGDSNRLALNIFTVLVWVFMGLTMISLTFAAIVYKANQEDIAIMGKLMLQIGGMVIGYGIARSIYTGFTEVKKDSAKSNFRVFAAQLPVTKEDIIKAQFLDILQCILPAVLMLVYMIIMTASLKTENSLSIYIGVLVAFLIVLFLMVCIEKGVFTYFFINNRVREVVYVAFAMLSALVIFVSQDFSKGVEGYLDTAHSLENTNSLYYVAQGLNFLGGIGGIVSLLLMGIIGYYLSCYIPIKIYNFREGRK